MGPRADVNTPLQPSTSIWSTTRATNSRGTRLLRNSGGRSTAPDPDQLRKFYDRQFWEAKNSPSRSRKDNSYSPLASWEGMSQKDGAFSRFEHCFTVNKPNRQIGVVGPQVIEMEATPPGGIFENAVTAGHTRPIPPSAAEALIGPVVRRGLSEGEEIVKQEAHLGGHCEVTVPEVKAVLVPEFMRRAGSQADQILLNPRERRQIMEFERDAAAARSVLHKAEGDKRRLVQLLKSKHPAGVVGVDSTANTDSDIYGAVARRSAERASTTGVRASQRARYLSQRDSFDERLGFNPLEHSEGPDPMATVRPRALSASFQRKRPSPAGPQVQDTHERVFGKDPVRSNPLRTQHLYDQAAGGRDYDIITGVLPGLWRPTYIPQERVNSRLAHPSQQSLERGRLTQGAPDPTYRASSPFLDPAY